MGRFADFAKKAAKRGAGAAGRGATAAGRGTGRFAKNRVESGYEARLRHEDRKAQQNRAGR
jgi:hypothetical protein